MGKAGVVKKIAAGVILLAGLFVLMYPALSGYFNERSQTAVISNYEQAVAALESEDRARSYEAAKAYNEALTQSQSVIIDPFGAAGSNAEPQEVSFLSIGPVMGYIQIPKIGIKAPIYEGTSEDVLQKGIGWLKGTSLPVGGASTNSVLTGHRGLPTAKLFTDIDQLASGDEFFIRNTMEILAYKVVATRVIEPSETEVLALAEGKDRVTLLTCHPYMINNQRLLVIGERIPYTGQLDEANASPNLLEAMTTAEKDLGIAALIGAGFIVLVILMFLRPWRRRRRDTGGHDV